MGDRPAHTRDPDDVAALRARVEQVKTGAPSGPVNVAGIRANVFRVLLGNRPKG